MKATGIVRRIDELGRIVIPKEIRRTLRLREGEALEIYTEKTGEIILKKYSPIAQLSQYAQSYAEAFFQATSAVCIVADRDNIVAVSGTSRKELLDRGISKELDDIITQRKTITNSRTQGFVNIIQGDMPSLTEKMQIIAPISSQGEAKGAIIVYMNDEHSAMSSGKSLAQTGATFLGKLMEE
ncbi:MAG: AbrB/MazE/SpoVT family DNA-binding domain-containing protein [Anaerofustis stercorihominis]|nr:AbrB/MazE/SpoVT family DNA-binding domain-containing protein [Anaerofustis stercorihominis]